jgi:hypothetical protein
MGQEGTALQNGVLYFETAVGVTRKVPQRAVGPPLKFIGAGMEPISKG